MFAVSATCLRASSDGRAQNRMFLLPYCVLARTRSSSDFPWMENRERLPEGAWR
jgi:hypothetical protein